MGDKDWPKVELTFDSVEYEQGQYFYNTNGFRQDNFPYPFPDGQPRSCLIPARDVRANLSTDDNHKLTQFCGDRLKSLSMLTVSFVLQNCIWDEFHGKPLREELDQAFPKRTDGNKITVSCNPVHEASSGWYKSMLGVLGNPRVVTKFDSTLATLWIRMLPGRVLQRRVLGGVTGALIRDLIVDAESYLLSYTDVETGKFDRVMITNVHEFNFFFLSTAK